MNHPTRRTLARPVLLLWVCAGLAAPAWAQPADPPPPDKAAPGERMSPPVERPFPGMRDRRGPDGDRGFGPSRNPRVWQRFAPGQPIDDATWERIQPFLQQNAPNRMEIHRRLVEHFGPDSPQVRMARQRIGGRVLALESMQNEDPEMHEIALEQFTLEDQIIAAMRKASREQTDSARQEVQSLIRTLVLNNLREREARLERLRAMLDREEQLLQRDRDQVDTLTDRMARRFREDFRQMVEPRPSGEVPPSAEPDDAPGNDGSPPENGQGPG